MRNGLRYASFGCVIFFSFAAGEEYTSSIDRGETRSISIILEAHQIFLVYLETPPDADLALSVHGPRDSLIGVPMKTNRLHGILFSTPAADTYRIEVRSVSGSATFSLNIETVSILDGSLQEGECWQYGLPLAWADRCYLLLTPEEGDLDLLVYDRNHDLVTTSESPGDQPEELEFRAPLRGTTKYVIEVRARSGPAAYRLLLIYDKNLGVCTENISRSDSEPCRSKN